MYIVDVKRIDAQALSLLVAQGNVLVRVQLRELGVAAAEVDDDQADTALEILPEDVVGQEGLALAGRGEDGKVPCLDPFFPLVPYVLQYGDVVLAVVEDDAGGVRSVVRIVDQQAERMFQVGHVQVLVGKIGGKAAVAVQQIVFPFLAFGIVGHDVQLLELRLDLGGDLGQLPGLLCPKDNVKVPPNDPGAVVPVDLVEDGADLFVYHLVLGTEIGTLVQFLQAFFEQLAPLVPIVQMDDLVDDMVLVEVEPDTVDKALVENKIIGGKGIVGLAAVHLFPEAQLVVDGQHVEIMVADQRTVPVEDDIRIEALVEPVEETVGQGQYLRPVHGYKIHLMAVVQEPDGIPYRTGKAVNVVVQVLGHGLGHFFERIDVLGPVQPLVPRPDEEKIGGMGYGFAALEIRTGRLCQESGVRQPVRRIGQLSVNILFVDHRPGGKGFQGLEPTAVQVLEILFGKGMDLGQVGPVAEHEIAVARKDQVPLDIRYRIMLCQVNPHNGELWFSCWKWPKGKTLAKCNSCGRWVSFKRTK